MDDPALHSETSGSVKCLSTKDGVRIQGTLMMGGRAYLEREAAVGLAQLIIDSLNYYWLVVGRIKESDSATGST